MRLRRAVMKVLHRLQCVIDLLEEDIRAAQEELSEMRAHWLNDLEAQGASEAQYTQEFHQIYVSIQSSRRRQSGLENSFNNFLVKPSSYIR